MADEVKLLCPTCHGEVKLGDIECSHCGTNLKSGESFETRVKQAKGKGMHPEHFGGRIAAAVVFALGIALFSGYMWERSVRQVMTDRLDLFEHPVLELQGIDDMIARAHRQQADREDAASRKTFADALRRTDELIDWIDKMDTAIKPDVPYTKAPSGSPSGRRPQDRPFNQPLAKRQLKNLRAKAQVRRESIPVV